MLFGLHVRNNNRDRTPPLVTLKAVCGPRDIDDPDRLAREVRNCLHRDVVCGVASGRTNG